MAGQRPFWNWEDDDLTFDLNRWLIGLIDSGCYRGFDASVGNGSGGVNMTLELFHTDTGALRTNIDRTLSNRFGVIVSKQGVVVQEDESIFLDISPTTTMGRYDLVVLQHEYKEIEGGVGASYLVIEGTPESAPTMSNPNIQVPVGILYLPENTNTLNKEGVRWIKSKKPAFANSVDFIEKSNGVFLTDLSGNGNRIINLGNPINAQDAATKSYVDSSIVAALKYASETQRGIIEIADMVETLSGSDDLRAITPYKLSNYFTAFTATQEVVNAGIDPRSIVTPKTLAGRTSTTERKGIIKIATEAEAADPTNNEDAITPFLLAKLGNSSQQIVEITSWDLTDGDKVIPHNYDWWNKVVGATYALVRDDGTLTFEDVGGSIAIKVTGSSITLTPKSPSTDYNATGFVRGHLIFWVKNDIVQPPATIVVNAGPDQSFTRVWLRYGTPVLRKLTLMSRSYTTPNVTFGVKVGYELGESNNSDTVRVYYRKAGSGAAWYSDGSAVYNNGTVVFTVGSNGEGPTAGIEFRLGVLVSGSSTQEIFSNVVNTVGIYNADIGTTEWNDNTSTTVLTPFAVNLSGYAESIGSALNETVWSVISKPTDAATAFGNANSLITTFIADKFGEYVLRLTGNNTVPMTATDDMTINLIQQANVPPTAGARWADGTTGDKTITWQVYNPTTGQNNGPYYASFNAGSSTDVDGQIVGYYWQKNYADNGWVDLESNSGTYPNTPSVNMKIEGDGNWKFRVRVKDNVGAVSDWSNAISMNITGSIQTVFPLDSFYMQTISGGSGQWNVQGQLIISPVAKVARLEASIEIFNGGAVTSTDIYYKFTGVGTVSNYLMGVGVHTVVMTAIKSSSISITMDIRNTPPYKTVKCTFYAYDSANNKIGEYTTWLGHG